MSGTITLTKEQRAYLTAASAIERLYPEAAAYLRGLAIPQHEIRPQSEADKWSDCLPAVVSDLKTLSAAIRNSKSKRK